MQGLQKERIFAPVKTKKKSYLTEIYEADNCRKESIVITEERLTQVKRLTKKIVLRVGMEVGMPSKYLFVPLCP